MTNVGWSFTHMLIWWNSLPWMSWWHFQTWIENNKRAIYCGYWLDVQICTLLHSSLNLNPTLNIVLCILSVTPTQRTARARKKNHSFWPVRCPSLGVCQHSLLVLVRRARWAYGIYSLSFAVCIEVFVHAQNCALSSTHESTRRKDARHARSALDQRQIRAERSLGIRCVFVGWGVASTQRTPGVLPAHV